MKTTTMTRGVGLLELFVVMAISLAAMTVAIPSFVSVLKQYRLTQTAAQIASDIQFARNASMASGKVTVLLFNSDSVKSCYTVYSGTSVLSGTTGSCTCTPGTSGSSCSGSAVELRTVQMENASTGLLSWDSTRVRTTWHLTFDPLNLDRTSLQINGMSDVTTRLTLAIDTATSLKLQFNMYGGGAVTVCSPTGSKMWQPSC